ncbi:Transposase [Oopsacas minuta]|uniref:Transposase n=1 Tax=Oopsacas minuta TaxID=111878 RepID=A0AAV7JLM2_9METZ|nr:Transposase [Oopsacas minuta]
MASNLKFEQRSYIKIRTLLVIGPNDILIDLEVVYGDASLSYTTVKEWTKRFHEGRESLKDEERIGPPRSAVTSSNTSEIRWRVKEDPHITVEELVMSVGISTGAVHFVLIDELKDNKVSSRWIPHSLTKDQKGRG